MSLEDLPAERVWGEIEKLLLQAERPSLGFTLARELGIVERLWPEMAGLIGCEQEPDWHPEGDVWVHTLMVVDQARSRLGGLSHPEQVIVMLGAVCHDFGKPLTTAVIDGRIRSPGHEPEGVPPTLAWLDRLNLHTIDGFDVRHHVVGLVAYHLAPGMWHKSSSPVSDGFLKKAVVNLLPEGIVERPKEGFVLPIFDWMVDKLRDYSFDILSNKRVNSHHFFNREAVQEIVKDYHAGKKSNATKVWNLMMFQVWWEKYFG